MIVNKEFNGITRGRDPLYDFKSLIKKGQCLILEPTEDIKNFRRKVGTALYHWKKYNKHDWKSAVRIEDGKICVYRVS